MPAQFSSTPQTKTFQLTQLDERQGVPSEEATTVTIKLATVKENTERSGMFAEFVKEIANPEEINQRERLIFRLPFYQLVALEVELTMVDCNIMNGDKPLFRFKKSPTKGMFLDMNSFQFKEAWGLLDDETAAEIHEKVLEMNPHWMLGAQLEAVTLGED